MLFLSELIAFLLGQTPAANTLTRANVALAKVQDLQTKLNDPASVARTEREKIKAETDVNADSNPYFKLDDQPRLLACITAAMAQGTQPELILALWMKEATVNVFSDVALAGPRAVTTADDAKAMFIAMNFFKFLGSDIFTRFKTGTNDNTLLENGSFAGAHRDVLDRANADLLQLGVAKADYAKAMRDNLTVTGGSSGTPFRVQAGGLFYAAMLALSHAHFEKLRTQHDALFDELGLQFPLSNSLAYIFYNNGRGARNRTTKGAFALIKSNMARATAANRGLEDFLMHTKIVGHSWEEPRTNLVRFDYYRKCYAPIFA